MSAVAQWVTPPRLSKAANEELKSILNGLIPNRDIPRVKKMLEDAYINQQLEDHKSTQKQFTNQLEVLKTHLIRIERALRSMSAINKQLLDQSCWHASGRKKIFNSAWLSKPLGSVAHLLVHWLLQGVEFHLKNMSKPDKARRSYTSSIAKMADSFESLLPSNAVSYQPASIFSRLVKFWLQEYCNDPETKPRSFIQKAIELRKSKE